jgi:uncharacterized membrane protein
MEPFTAGAFIRFGWETFKKRPWFFVGVAFLFCLLTAVFSGISTSFGHQGVGQSVGSLINIVAGTFIGLGVTAFFLKAHDSPLTVTSSELWHPQTFWSFFAVKLLSAVVIIIGFILLIVPGIIVALMLVFAPYLVVDKQRGPIEAMRESMRLTSGHKWMLLRLMVLIILLNILGAICFLVGLLVTIPVTSLAIVHAYRLLSPSTQPAA